MNIKLSLVFQKPIVTKYADDYIYKSIPDWLCYVERNAYIAVWNKTQNVLKVNCLICLNENCKNFKMQVFICIQYRASSSDFFHILTYIMTKPSTL